MKKIIIITAVSLFFASTLITLSMAASDSHGSSHNMTADDGHNASHDMDAHGSNENSHQMSATDGMSHGVNNGNAMHSSMVGDYHFSYELIDMREKMKGMAGMPAMKSTHHMMLFIKSADGHMAKNAKVGYLVENPDGTTQKIMTMGMGEGFGGDVDFAAKGVYTIKVKAVAGEEKIVDTFKYEVK